MLTGKVENQKWSAGQAHPFPDNLQIMFSKTVRNFAVNIGRGRNVEILNYE